MEPPLQPGRVWAAAFADARDGEGPHNCWWREMAQRRWLRRRVARSRIGAAAASGRFGAAERRTDAYILLWASRLGASAAATHASRATWLLDAAQLVATENARAAAAREPLPSHAQRLGCSGRPHSARGHCCAASHRCRDIPRPSCRGSAVCARPGATTTTAASAPSSTAACSHSLRAGADCERRGGEAHLRSRAVSGSGRTQPR